jgi:protease-4
MIRRFFRGLWRTVTVVRGALANLFFLAVLILLLSLVLKGPDPLPDRAALRLGLAGSVVDARTRLDAGELLFEGEDASREILLTDLIDAIDLARSDERITSLVIEMDGLVSIGQSRTTELAQAIERFRATGKPVVAAADYYTQDQYRLAVEADYVLMHPFGAVALEGYGYYVNYFAEALEKLSVSMHVYRAGDFKSIAEVFLRDDMSPGERAISERWLDDLWGAYRGRVEGRRELPEGGLDALLAAFPERLREAGGNSAEFALREGLVDEVLDRRQREAYLASLVGASDADGAYAGIDFDTYLAARRSQKLSPGSDTVAVVTAQGNILPGRQGLGTIGSESLVDTLRRAVGYDSVRALVLRVNSGGGSVFASEIIRAELERIRSEEGLPVVVSMGSVAASGGYYISTAADRILATPTSLTGSIGVFAAFPTFERLLARGGISTDGVGTTPLAGGLRPDRPIDPAVDNALQQGVDDVYEQFLDLVATSRDLDREALSAVAEGRVLSAPQAASAGLIDGLGSLDDAAAAAAELAGLAADSYQVISVRPAIPPGQLLLQRLGQAFGQVWVPRSLAAFAGGMATYLAPTLQAAGLFAAAPDPRNLYVYCAVCAAP